jgi:rhodanese-related sulfurtransferase
MIDNGTVQVVVDVREELTEYCEAADPLPNGHIPGAVNYPWSSLYLRAHFRELPADKTILVYCGVGGRSAAAAQFLCVNGYSTVYNMTGGMSAWTYPTEQCCFSPAECDDGLWCNGQETCQSMQCQPGSRQCLDAYTGCSEELGLCVDCLGDYDCDNATDGQDNCLTAPNGLWLGTCVKQVAGLIKGTGVPCTDNATCGSGQTCQMEQGDMNGNTIGDACECYADATNDGKVNLTDLGKLKAEFGKTNCSSTPVCIADSNDDNKVNLTDLTLLKAEFGKTNCPFIAVP